MPVKAPIVGFLQSARRAGLRISVAESLDAFAALDTVGYDDRALLKESLGLVLAKTAGDKRLFDACFERYFSRDGFVRFVRLDQNLEIEIYGEGVEKHASGIYRLTKLD